MPEIGSYVTAKLKGVDDYRQGILNSDPARGTFEVRGQFGIYICEGTPTLVDAGDKS